MAVFFSCMEKIAWEHFPNQVFAWLLGFAMGFPKSGKLWKIVALKGGFIPFKTTSPLHNFGHDRTIQVPWSLETSNCCAWTWINASPKIPNIKHPTWNILTCLFCIVLECFRASSIFIMRKRRGLDSTNKCWFHTHSWYLCRAGSLANDNWIPGRNPCHMVERAWSATHRSSISFKQTGHPSGHLSSCTLSMNKLQATR